MVSTRTKKIVIIAMLSAIAYAVMVVGRIPVVLFLKYDPKDVIITIGGFLYGPLASAAMSAIVSTIEMFTVSDTGFYGLVMNIISTCSFACTAAVIYKAMHTMKGAVIGLVAGALLTTAVMVLWNYIIAPIYMGMPRQAVAELIIPVFLPFNLLKGSLNAAITVLLYKPLKAGLTAARLLPETGGGAGKPQISITLMLTALFVLITGILVILVFQGVI